MGEIIQLENLGFCLFGEGGIISERSETRIGGRIPVNPSDGLNRKDIRSGRPCSGRYTSS